MNLALALVIVAALVCATTIALFVIWLQVKGPKGQLEERVAAIEAKLPAVAMSAAMKRG